MDSMEHRVEMIALLLNCYSPDASLIYAAMRVVLAQSYRAGSSISRHVKLMSPNSPWVKS